MYSRTFVFSFSIPIFKKYFCFTIFFVQVVNLDDSSSCQEEEISKRTLEDAENVAIQLLAGRFDVS